ncbi:PilW family protein [Marinagarivorans algicola]|uniref:PilW family protein n=1 Tax=Marinagarivorans algicola TaxID=1513270 RepID=UPI0006B8B0D1|nr:PilW family protein [Marinagarivorans algicola]
MQITIRRKYTGISLVGLMIALLLGSILLSGLITVFSSNQTTSRLMFDFGSLQEGARAANHVLESSIRQAGHFGGVDPIDILTNSSLTLKGKGNCNHAWITATSEPIRAYDGNSTITHVTNLPNGCIEASDYVANTDILSLKYGSTIGMAKLSDLDANTVYVRTVTASNEQISGEIFKGDSKPSIGGSSDALGIYNFKYASELYYIRACSQKINGVCHDNIPSLVRYQLDGLEFKEYLLIAGVEQFQIEFGIDSDADYNADQYLSPSAIKDWQQVISVKFSLVIRGKTQDNSLLDTETYTLVGNVNYIPKNEDQAYRRRTYTKVVQLRNMVRG